MTAHELNIKQKQEVSGEETTRPGRAYVPDVDICETPNILWLWADMPGVDEHSVDVTYADGVLTIEGRVSVAEYEQLQPVYTEYNIGNYRRRFSLSQDLDVEHIKARMTNGVLELQLPKGERAKPRKIQIEAA